MKSTLGWNEKVMILIVLLSLFASLIIAADSSSTNYNTNSTAISGGGSDNITSTNFENYDISIPDISGNSSSINFVTDVGFTHTSSVIQTAESETTAETTENTTSTTSTAAGAGAGSTTSAPLIDPIHIFEIIKPGTTIEKEIIIKNTFDEKTFVRIELEGIEEIIEFTPEEFYLEARESQIVKVFISVPESYGQGIYSGILNIRTDRSLTKLQLTIGVEREQEIEEKQIEEKQIIGQKEQAKIKEFRKTIQIIIGYLIIAILIIISSAIIYERLRNSRNKPSYKTERILKKYIKDAKKVGMPSKKIYDELRKSGWPKRLIKKYLK